MSDSAENHASFGLDEAEARRRLAAEGPNELPRADRRTPLRIVFDALREPMSALLVGGGTLYLVLGDTVEALVLLTFATLSIVITVVQESRTERILDALRDLTAPRAVVVRDGERRRIDARELVRGDALCLAEGDRVPADAALRVARDLMADESLLTGESVPLAKTAFDGPVPADLDPGGEASGMLWSGTLIVRGTAVAEVVATGARSQIGRIGASLHAIEPEAPRLRRETRRLVTVFALIGGAVSVTAVVLHGLLRGGWLDGLLAGIALGMSMLPEEFPLVLTVFMAMGAWRISRARVLTRRGEAIEALGSTTVLCTDKTGTLTENRMAVAELRPLDGEVVRLAGTDPGPLSPAARALVRAAVLACARNPHDPMETAFHDLARARAADVAPPTAIELELVREYGLRPDLLALTRVWRETDAAPLRVAAKGAPEAIAALCRLSPAETAALRTAVDDMAGAGLRVLGVAEASVPGPDLPETPRDFAFSFLGLTGLADPLRAGVPEAVRQCRSAGIRIVMITGDHPETARAIAARAGLDTDDLVTGPELDRLDDADLAERVRTATIFARILPDRKLRIVEALIASGEVVAMTGDGVNDAPALRAAHIGVAMGGRGTDVAREAAAIVLLDDDFGSIVRAVRLGRRVWDNLRKAMGFILAVHVPIGGLALLPLIFGLPILFGPVHIAFLEMVIDPVCSLVFEAESEERDVMDRPPRDPRSALVSRALLFWGLLQGVIAFVAVAAVQLWSLRRAMPVDEVRSLTFFALVFVLIALIFVGRSFRVRLAGRAHHRNRTLWVVLTAVSALLALSLAWPPAGGLLRFGPLHLDDLAAAAAAGLGVLAILQLLKRTMRSAFTR